MDLFIYLFDLIYIYIYIYMLQVFCSLNLMLLAMVNSQLHMRNMWQKRGQSSNSMGYVPTNQWKNYSKGPGISQFQ